MTAYCPISRHALHLAIAFAAALAMALAGCKPLLTKTAQPDLPVEAQEEKALEELNQMLETTARLPHSETRQIIEKGYHDIIRKYPGSDIAHESYYRLIVLNIRDFEMPREEEAERLYREYFERYPDAKLTRPINFTIARYYYEFGRWDKLVNFCVPFVQRLIETGNMDNSLCMFYYSEAHLNLKNYDEALRGYVTYLQHYPDAPMANFSKTRIGQINKLKEQKPGEEALPPQHGGPPAAPAATPN